jgi:hypothetical protein
MVRDKAVNGFNGAKVDGLLNPFIFFDYSNNPKK